MVKLAAILALLLAGCATAPPRGRERTAERPPTGVLQLGVRKLASFTDVGDVSDLALLDPQGATLLVAGTCGFAEVDLARGAVLRSRRFELPCPPFIESRIVDMDADGELDFARFYPGWVGPTAVLDRGGAVRWQTPTPGACATVADLDGDGRSEILTREANSDVVELLDDQGRVRWSRPIPDTALTVFDTDGDGRQEILASDGKALRIHAADGSRIGSTEVPGGGYVNAIEIASHGTPSGAPEIIVGAYIDGGPDAGQWFHRYARDARTHLGRERADLRVESEAEMAAGPTHGRLFLTLVNELRQAAPAGFESSELTLRVTGEAGETLAEAYFPDTEEGAALEAGLLVLEGSAPGVLVGYGDGLWKVTLP